MKELREKYIVGLADVHTEFLVRPPEDSAASVRPVRDENSGT